MNYDRLIARLTDFMFLMLMLLSLAGGLGAGIAVVIHMWKAVFVWPA